MARRWVVYIKKGGTAKTTSVINLGSCLVLSGKIVYIFDTDGQCSASKDLGKRAATQNDSILAVLNGTRSVTDVALPVGDTGRLFLVPGSPAMYTWRYNEAGIDALRRAIVGLKADDIFIDCAPADTDATKVAIAGATDLIIPCQPNIPDLRSAFDMPSDLAEMSRKISYPVNIAGLFLTRVERCNIHRDGIAFVQSDACPLPVCDTMISKSVAVVEASLRFQSMFDYRPKHKVTDQYRALAQELGML